MKKLLLLAFIALFFPAYSSTAQAELSFEHKLYDFQVETLQNAYAEHDKTFAACEADDADVVVCIIESIHRVQIAELFEEHNPQNRSIENTDFTLLAERYKAAFTALAGVFKQVERSMPQKRLSSKQEDDLREKLGKKPVELMTAAERNDYKKIITSALIKTHVPDILCQLRPYQSILFDNILTNSPQREKVARKAIDSLIKINRKELDKRIKEVLASFDKKIKG